MASVSSFLDEGFMPHGNCLTWNPELLMLHVGGDLITAISYFVIPTALIFLVRRRDDLTFDRIFLLFATFILFCGLTHLIDVINIWNDYYFLEGWMKTLTGGVSIITAVMIWRLMPRALSIPSAAQLMEKNKALAKAETELLAANQLLELRIQQRTVELEKMAITDALTGLYNRRELINRLNNELERCVRYDEPLCALMIDMDDFKNINDRYGHLFGDDVLVKAAEAFVRSCRASDVIGRYGGEEFLILLPNTTLDKATMTAKRICSALSEIPFAVGDNEAMTVTCSIGVSQFETSLSAEQLLRIVDTALYEAKRTGKNKVVVSAEIPDE